jgi:fucose 4-O-acetylase-like acetyltransferase
MSAKKRLNYVDAARGIGIILIMYGHVTGISNPVDNWMSSFKVAIFYIISGVLLAYNGSIQKRDYRTYAGKIMKNDFLPYLWFSIFAIMVKTGFVYLSHAGIPKILSTLKGYTWDSLFLKGINSLWFLPTLIIGELVFYFIIKGNIFIKIMTGILGVFSLPFFHWLQGFTLSAGEAADSKALAFLLGEALVRLEGALGKGCLTVWFLGAGYIGYKLYSRVRDKKILLTVGIVFSIANVFLSQMNPHVDINNLKWGESLALFHIFALVGSFGAIFILDYFGETLDFKFPALSWWGVNSLTIMCTHTALNIKKVIYKGVNASVHIPDYFGRQYLLKTLMVLVIMMLAEVGICALVNNYFPFLTGKRAAKAGIGDEKAGSHR